MDTENRATGEESTASTVAELNRRIRELEEKVSVIELQRKVAELEEILNGYERAPSLEEIKAHLDSNMGAAWLCVFEGRARIEEGFLSAKYARGAGARRWWPLLDGKPVARPRLPAGGV